MSSVEVSFFKSKSPLQLLAEALRKTLARSGAIFAAAAAMLVPGSAIILVGQYLMGKSGLQALSESLRGPEFDPTQLVFGWEMVAAAATLMGGAFVWGLSAFAASAAIARTLAEWALGREFTPSQAWDFVMGRLFKLVSGGIVALSILAVGYMLAAIPGGILSVVVMAKAGKMTAGSPPPMWINLVSLVFILPALIVLAAYLVSMAPAAGVEELGGIGAAIRSFRLMRGNFWHVVAVVALGAFATLGPTGVVQGLMQGILMDDLRQWFGDANGMLIANVPATLLGLIVWPILFAIQALVYFDLRSRQLEEDFTPHELALDVGGELSEDAANPALGDFGAAATAPPAPASDPPRDSPANIS